MKLLKIGALLLLTFLAPNAIFASGMPIEFRLWNLNTANTAIAPRIDVPRAQFNQTQHRLEEKEAAHVELMNRCSFAHPLPAAPVPLPYRTQNASDNSNNNDNIIILENEPKNEEVEEDSQSDMDDDLEMPYVSITFPSSFQTEGQYVRLEQDIRGHYFDHFRLPRELNNSGLYGIYGFLIDREAILEKLISIIDAEEEFMLQEETRNDRSLVAWYIMHSIFAILQAGQVRVNALPSTFLNIHGQALQSLCTEFHAENRSEKTKWRIYRYLLDSETILKDYIQYCMGARVDAAAGDYAELSIYDLSIIGVMEGVSFQVYKKNSQGHLVPYESYGYPNAHEGETIHLLSYTLNDPEQSHASNHFNLLVPTGRTLYMQVE